MEAWSVPGVALGVVKDDRVLLAEGLGTGRVGADVRIGPDTVWAVGSLTKSFTASAAALLVDEGLLRWDDPVFDLLPGFSVADPYVTRELTVRDLLSHRSGLKDVALLYTGTRLDPAALLARVHGLELKSSFRSRFTYNNMLYLVAGSVMESVSGRPYADLVRERLLEPLGMGRTTVGPGSANGAVVGHALLDGALVALPEGCGDMDVVAPASAVRSTLSDLLTWAAFHLRRGKVGGKAVLRPESAHELGAQQVVSGVSRIFWPAPHFPGYGLGWFVGDHNGRKAVLGMGRMAGMTTDVMLVPEERLGVVVMANLDLSWMSLALGWEIVDQALGDPRRDWSIRMLKSRREAAVEARSSPGGRPSLDPASYAGTYRDRLYGDLEVAWEDGLRLRYNEEVHGRLEHDNFDTFALRSESNPLLDHRGVRITFRLDPLGGVEALELSYPTPQHRDLERVRFERRG